MDELSTQRYLDTLRRHLHRLPEGEREEALREVASHIAEAREAGKPTASVLAQLSDPRQFAGAYLADHYTRRVPAMSTEAVKSILVLSGFAFGTGVVSLVLIPFLGLVAAGFAVAAVLSPVLGLLRTFGATWIVIGVSGGWQVPAEWSMPVALVIGAVCAVISVTAYRLLRRYLGAVTAEYRRWLPGDRSQPTVRGS